MAKKEKQVSISAIDKVLKDGYQNVITAAWNGVDITITKTISFEKTLEFIDDVVACCVTEEGGFNTAGLKFAIRSNVIARYTNISLPDNLEHRHQFLYETDLVEFVCSYINATQIGDIEDAIDSKLDYIYNNNLAAFEAKVAEVAAAMENMLSQTQDAMSGFSMDDLMRVTQAFNENGMDEAKLVNAFMDAKGSKSDVDD